MQKKIKQQAYSCLSSQSNPNSLVILAQNDHIIQDMFTKVQCKFVWIEPMVQLARVRDVEAELGVRVRVFGGVGEALGVIEGAEGGDGDEKGSEGGRVVVVCAAVYEEEAKALLACHDFKLVIMQPFSWSSQPQSQPLPPPLQQTSDQLSYILIKSKAQLLQTLKSLKISHLQTKKLPNFIPTTLQTWSSNLIIKIMLGMLNQEDCEPMRKMLVKEMCAYFGEIVRHKNFHFENFGERVKMFFTELDEGRFGAERAIFWYTQETPLYRLVNSLLRSAKHPAQAYYIQPYFKDLFEAVQSMTEKSMKKSKKIKGREAYGEEGAEEGEEGEGRIRCYRGGIITKEEIAVLESNVGGVVENLGFFSTSEHLETALSFVWNVLFQIQIDCTNPEGITHEFGFARISKNSNYPGQSQILFNPMNSFKILQIKSTIDPPQPTESQYPQPQPQPQTYTVKLSYGEFDRIIRKPEQSCNAKQNNLKELLKIRKQVRGEIQCQGDILVQEFQVLGGGALYWERYCSMAKGYGERIKGLENLAFCCMFEHDYQGAERHLKLMAELIEAHQVQIEKVQEAKKQASNTIVAKNRLKYFSALNSLGINYLRNGDKASALQYFLKQKSLLPSLNQPTIPYLTTHKNLASTYQLFHSIPLAVQALQLCESALQAPSPNPSSSSPPTTLFKASILADLGNIYQELGLYAKALEFYQRGQGMRLALCGEEDFQYTRMMVNVGVLWDLLGQQGRALELLGKCRKIRGRVLGNGHPDFMAVQHEIAIVLRKIGDFEEALAIHHRILAKKIQHFGQKHWQLIPTYFQLSQIHQNTGNLPQSLHSYTLALPLLSTLYPPTSHYYNKIHNRYNLLLLERSLALCDLQTLREKCTRASFDGRGCCACCRGLSEAVFLGRVGRARGELRGARRRVKGRIGYVQMEGL